MGFGSDVAKVETWDVEKSKGGKKKKDEDDSGEDTGCWIKLRFIGSCITSRSKVDSSVSGTSTNYGNFPIFAKFVLRIISGILYPVCLCPIEAFCYLSCYCSLIIGRSGNCCMFNYDFSCRASIKCC